MVAPQKGEQTTTGEALLSARELLGEALTAPEVIKGLSSLGRGTHRKGIEGGLAIYTTESGWATSGVDFPTREAIEDRKQQLTDSHEAAAVGHTSYSGLEITHTYDTETHKWKARKDLALLIHSHPVRARLNEHWEDYLSPSLDDLETWEEMMVKNPDIAEGILVTDGVKAKILMYKKDSTGIFIPRYAMYDKNPPRQKMLDSMRTSHINIAEFTLPLKGDVDGDYEEGVQKALDILYS